MTNLSDAARRLRSRYVEGLPAKWWVLEEALGALLEPGRSESKSGEAEDTLRRLAHQVRGTAASFGFLVIDRAAFRLEHAESRAALIKAAEQLVEALRGAYLGESAPNLQLLLIDDDPSIGFIIKALLVEEHVEITQVTSAAAAQPALESTAWNMILVDLVLPDADGRALLAQIRGLPLHRDTPLVVLSAKTGSLVRNECSMYGIDAFLAKPIDSTTFAVNLAAVLGRSRALQSAAYDDALTELPNRVGFRRALEPLRAAAQRSHEPLSIALVDLDQFKQINDTYGHLAGDEHLVRVAGLLVRCLPDALIGRWGGEEFIVALPRRDPLASLALLGDAATALREQPRGSEPTIALTFSAGVTALDEGESLDAALLRADQLLYQAKRKGRARVMHTFEPSGEARAKLLIAEDDPELAALLLHDLDEEFEITHAPDGLTALALASRTNFDLVLLDYQMPGRNGAEVVRTLREWPHYATTPLLLLTAVGNDSAIEAAFDAGADDYIAKPHSRRSLLARLNRHLGRVTRQLGKPHSAPTTLETEVTALICEISGFTELASRTSPRELVELLDRYLPTLAEVVVRHGGTLEKYVGGALLAVWGVDQARPDDARRALAAALDIQRVVHELGRDRSPALAVHIGINSGLVAVASIGAGPLSQHVTVGATTNLASCICELAEPGEIAIGAPTFARLDAADQAGFEGPMQREIKGHDEPLTIHRRRAG